jgi:TolB protein
MTKSTITGVVAIALLAAWPHAQQPTQPPAPQQPTELVSVISGDGGSAPRLAVPEFIALSTDAETVATAKTISQVLWDDLNFEREFSFIPRDVYSSIPKATSFGDIPFDRWRELNADGLIVGTVQKVSAGFHVEMKLYNVRTRQPVYPRAYDGSNARLFAHTMSDEIHKSQRALNGVARSRLTFDSDRDGERMKGTVQNRGIKEIYISDYDGENQRRVTVGQTLNIAPRWSPDGRSIAFTSDRGGSPQIYLMDSDGGRVRRLTSELSYCDAASWSPNADDGDRIAFAARVPGGFDIFSYDLKSAQLTRLTDGGGINESPRWSPDGRHLVFTSDRSGGSDIYTMDANGDHVRRLTRGGSNQMPAWSR